MNIFINMKKYFGFNVKIFNYQSVIFKTQLLPIMVI